ncbi:MAG: hypothetical protein ABEH90_06570 [Halolamina sp.]
MSRDEVSDEQENEYADWEPPGQPADDEAAESEAAAEADEDWGPPPEMREPLLRDRVRDRLGVTPRQWYLVETLLLVLPYPFFVLVYVTFDVDETVFLTITLAYSLVATYVGFLS